jgi:hypothetical protein
MTRGYQIRRHARRMRRYGFQPLIVMNDQRQTCTPTSGPALVGWRAPNIAAKNLLGSPWWVAFALQDDSWILRTALVWHQPNTMPESVRDRMNCPYERAPRIDRCRCAGMQRCPGQQWWCSACAPALICQTEGHQLSPWRHPFTAGGHPAPSEHRHCWRCCRHESRPARQAGSEPR